MGGDDTFILIPDSDIQGKTLGKTLKFDSAFGEDVRVAVGTVKPDASGVSLKDIRLKFSETVDVLKTQELTQDHEHYAVIDETQKTIVVTKNNEEIFEAKKLEELKAFTTQIE